MSLIQTYKKIYAWAVTMKGLIKKEKQTWVPMPFHIRLKMWLNGFWSVSYFRYDFKKYKMSDYISDYQDNFKWSKVDNTYKGGNTYFDNKVLFPLISRHAFPLPENIGLIINGRILPLDNKNYIDNFTTLMNYILNRDVIIKPADGECGEGIHAIEIKNEKIFLDNREINTDDLEKKIMSFENCIICDRVTNPHEYAVQLYPDTLNTIRILTLVDPDTKDAFIAGAVQRIGTNYSYPVDNFHRGGIAANIDLETGELNAAAAIFPVHKDALVWHEKHPDTGSQIKGVKVANWNGLKTQLLKLANELSFCKEIGWDVAVTDNGFMLIEGNYAPDPKIHQLHEPLLLNPKVKRFCEYYKLL